MPLLFCRIVASIGLLVTLAPGNSGFPDYDRRKQSKCLPIQETLCTGFPYNETSLPNIVGHETQREASSRLREFLPLLESKCSPDLRFFLCSLYFPMCTPKVHVAIPACRPMCEEVRRNCEPLMATFGFRWSDSIDCSKLPVNSETDRLCMQPPNYERESEEVAKDEVPDEYPPYQHVEVQSEFEEYPVEAVLSDSLPDQSYLPSEDVFVVPEENTNLYKDEDDISDTWLSEEDIDIDGTRLEVPHYEEFLNKNDVIDVFPMVETPTIGKVKPKEILPRRNLCLNPLKFFFSNRSGECVPRCEDGTDVFFSKEDKRSAYILLSVCAALCFLSTTVTISTFIADSKRFRYPERPVIFLSMCYNLYSVGYLLRTISGIQSPLSCLRSESLDAEHLIRGGLENTSCSASFFILYYFGMAASAWWVVLTLSWLLSAGFKWSHEAIEGYGLFFHLLAWGLPAAQTIVVFALGKIDGDELTGVCYVGNLEPAMLMYFVIIPLTFYLLTGTVALVFGFSNLFKIRRVIKHQSGKEAANLEKLMLKIGMFSVLYTVPAACVVAVYFYQYQNYSLWINKASRVECMHASNDIIDYNYQEERIYSQFPTWKNQPQETYYYGESVENTPYQRAARSANGKMSYSEQAGQLFENINEQEIKKIELNCGLVKSIPSLPIFCIKIVMSLIAGIMSGIWIWSAKTVQSWRAFCYTCRLKKAPAEDTEVVEQSTPGVAHPLFVASADEPEVMRPYEEEIHFTGSPQCLHHSLERPRKYLDEVYWLNTTRHVPDTRRFLRNGCCGDCRCSQLEPSCCRTSQPRDVEGASADETPCQPQVVQEYQVVNACYSKHAVHAGLSSDYTESRGYPSWCRQSNPSSQTHLARCMTRSNRDDESRLFCPQTSSCLPRFEESRNGRTTLCSIRSKHTATADSKSYNFPAFLH